MGIKFSEYRRIKEEEEERNKGTGGSAFVATKKFSDIRREKNSDYGSSNVSNDKKFDLSIVDNDYILAKEREEFRKSNNSVPEWKNELEKLSPETKAAFDEYNRFVNNPSRTEIMTERTGKPKRIKAAKDALENQGLSADQFEHLYALYNYGQTEEKKAEEKKKDDAFWEEQKKAMDKLSPETKAAFEEYYRFLYNPSMTEKGLRILGLQDGYAREKVEKPKRIEAAKEAMAKQGIPADQFDSLFEYFEYGKNKEEAEKKEENLKERYTNGSTARKIGMNVASVGANVVEPLGDIGWALSEYVTPDKKNPNAPINLNSPLLGVKNYKDNVRNTTAEDIENAKLSFLYQTGMSTADFLTLLPENAVIPGSSLATMGINAGTDATKKATERGISDGRALATGIAQGAAEVVFEKLSLDHLWDIARKGGKAATRNAILNILAQAGIEGSEEVFTDIANYITDYAINGDLSEYNQEINHYLSQGKSIDEARRLANENVAKNVALSFAGGALSGGVLGTGAVAYTSYNGAKSSTDKATYKEIADNVDTDRNSYSNEEDYNKAMQVKVIAEALSKDDSSNYEKGLFEQAAKELTTVKYAPDQDEEFTQTMVDTYNENPNVTESVTLQSTQEQVESMADTYNDESVSKAYISNYKESYPLETYTRAFNSFMRAGYTDKSFDTVLKENDGIQAMIDKSTLQSIYYLGKNRADEHSAFYTNEEQQSVVNDMAKALGVKVKFVENIQGANGMYENGTISISKKSIQPAMVVFSHELTHDLKNNVPEAYQQYEDFVISYMQEYHSDDYQKLVENFKKHYGEDEALIREEIAANASETFLTDENAVKEFVSQNRTIADRIIDFLDKFIEKLKNLYSGYEAQTKAAKMISEDIETYEKARELWYQAVYDKQNNNYNETDENRYSLKSYDERQLKNWRTSNNIIIYEDDVQLLEFVKNALIDNREFKKMYLGKISEYSSDLVKSELNLDIRDYNCTLRTNEIRKIRVDHGSESTEAPRGQRGIIPDDYLQLRNILGHPDCIEDGGLYHNGKPVIRFKKNGLTAVALVSDKHLDITLQTMYAKRSLATGIDEHASINTSKTNSGTASSESIKQEHSNSKGNYSYKGVIALNNEESVLEKAFQMEKDGKNTEEIRKETGWFKQSDGKWRYEIDDSKAKVYRIGDAAFRNDEKYQKYMSMASAGDFFSEEYARLDDIYGDAVAHDFPNRTKLTDYFVHDELFKAYPVLNRIKLEKAKLNGVEGQTLLSSGIIRVDEKYFKSGQELQLKKVLLHEIQHIIQHIEGYSLGSNPEDAGSFDAYYNTPGEIEARDVAGRSELSPERRLQNAPVRFSIKDSEDNDLSQQQQDYFKDSIIRDEKGRLKVVYHGTRSDFTVFEHSKIGSTGSAEGYGFYFTDQENKASGYTGKEGKILKGYLNIQKPLSLEELTISRAELKKLLTVLDPTGDNILSSYDSSGIGYPSKRWYNNAMNDTLDILMENDSDVDLVCEVANIISDKTVIRKIKDLLGYDGYITTDKYSDGAVYVAFESNQFKNQSNTNPTTHDDIRFSLKEYADNMGLRLSEKDAFDIFEEILEEDAATDNMLSDTSKILEESAKAVKNLGNKAKISKSTAKDLALHYINEYHADYDADVLADNLYSIFGYIQKNDIVNYNDMIKVMKEVCKPVTRAATVIDEEAQKHYKEMVKLLKGYDIKLNKEQKAEMANKYGSYKAFHNKTFGRYHITENGSYLDSVWEELVELTGYAIPINTNPANQMLVLDEYMNLAQVAITDGVGDENSEQLAYDMALNIYTDYFKIIGNDNGELKKLHNSMNQRLIEYRKDIRKEYQEKYNKYKQEAEFKKNDEINYLRRQMQDIAHERDLAIKNIDQIRVLELENKIERYKYVIQGIKARNEVKILDLKAKDYEAYTKRALSGKKTAHKNHIKKKMIELQNALAKPTEKKYIPAGLVQSTIEICKIVNIDTGRSEKMAERLEELSILYDKLQADPDYAAASEYDEHTAGKIKQLRSIFNYRNITMLELEELEQVDDLVTELHHQFLNAGKLLTQEHNKDVYESALKCMEEVNNSKGYKDNTLGRFMNKYESVSLNAKRQLRRMTGYKDDAVTMKLFDALNEGQHKQMEVMRETARIFDDVTKGTANQRAMRQFVGVNEDDWVELKFTATNSVKVPKAFRVSLALHILNNANLDHIIYGGLTIPEHKAYQRGDYKEAYAKGRTIQFIPAGVYNIENGKERAAQKQKAYEEAKRTLQKIASEMTPFERQFYNKAEVFFHEYTGKKINEVSMQLNGYKKARVHNYFPIKTDSNFNHADIEALIRNGTIEGMGMLTSRVGARNPILLEDVTQVINRQAKNVAKYYGLALPVRDFNKVYNTTELGYKKSMKSIIAKKWGVEGQKYIENLLVDLQSHRGEENTFLDQLQGNFAAATLTMNLSVTMKQAASYPTAAYSLGWDAIMHALPKFKDKVDMDLIEKYTPLLWYRNQGNSTQEIAEAKKKGIIPALEAKLPDKYSGVPGVMVNWIQMVDTKTVGTLWKAAEYKVEKLYPNLKNGTEDYYKEVAKVFNDAVEETQPNYTVLQRPDILRNPNKLIKQLVMFKTQPLQNFGILYDATNNLISKKAYKDSQDEKELKVYKEAQDEFARAVSSQAVAAAVFAAMTLIAKSLTHKMDSYRDDDDDITALSILKTWFGDVMSSMAGAFVGGTELYDLVRAAISGDKYYGMEVSTVGTLSDLANDMVKLTDDVNAKNLVNVSEDISVIAGVPLKNVVNIFKGIGLHIEDTVNGELLSFNAGHDTKLATEYTAMLNAIFDDDEKKYQKHYENAMNMLLLTKDDEESKKTLTTGIKTKLGKMYKAGDVSYNQAHDILVNKLDLTEDDAFFALEKWENGSDYSKYDDLKEALKKDSGIDDAMHKLIEHGVEEDTVKTQLIKSVKELYQSGDISKGQATNLLKKYKKMDDNDVYWKFKEWESGDSDYSKYDNLKKGIESGTFDSVIVEYLANGYTAESIKAVISNMYRKQYIEYLQNNKQHDAYTLREKLGALKINGKKLYTQSDWMNWNKTSESNKEK